MPGRPPKKEKVYSIKAKEFLKKKGWKPLPLVKIPDSEGYYLSDIEVVAYPSEVRRLYEWLKGRSVIMYKDRGFIAKKDLEHFLGRKITDQEEQKVPKILEL